MFLINLYKTLQTLKHSVNPSLETQGLLVMMMPYFYVSNNIIVRRKFTSGAEEQLFRSWSKLSVEANTWSWLAVPRSARMSVNSNVDLNWSLISRLSASYNALVWVIVFGVHRVQCKLLSSKKLQNWMSM